MRLIRCNTNRIADRQRLIRRGGGDGFIPRIRPYGKLKNIPPLEDYGAELVPVADFKEEIQYAHEQKIFPVYHQWDTWLPKGQRWNQNGLNYCWAWSLTDCVSNTEAREDGTAIRLAPVSLGWTVNWRNAGNYLEDGVNAVIERGICEAEYVPDQHSLSYRRYKEGWQDNALLHRIAAGRFWDVDTRDTTNMLRGLVTSLTDGYSAYIAYNWWGHAVPIVALRWNESVLHNIEVWIQNSHDNDDVTVMTGARAFPDEAIIILATVA